MENGLLVSLDEYMKSGIHIGMQFRTRYMNNFIYKIRNDKISLLNINKIDERIRIAIKFLSSYNPKDILAVCRRENGFAPLQAFSRHTGIRAIAGRYMPGTLTNPNSEYFTEAKLLLAVDSYVDRIAIKDANSAGIPVVCLSDSNNKPNMIDLIIPCNNKGTRSLTLIFYLLAQGLTNKELDKLEFEPEISIPLS